MKLKYIFSMLMAFLAVNALAQDAEYDDMYFNSKDRAKLTLARGEGRKVEEKVRAKEKAADEINPTDSYSARNVNPEFTARSNSESAQADNEDYFVNNYQLQRQSQFNNFNRGYNSWYNDPWYSSAYYSAGINNWNSPYYGSGYNRYGNPWYDPYYQSGWSSSYSFYYGNNWNYGWNNGWNMSYGCPNYWNNPFYSSYYSSWYSPYNSYYSPYGYGYGNGYPTVVVVENGRGPVYGKRGTRGTSFVQNTGTRSRTVTPGNNNSNGRVATRRQDEYYQRTWQPTQETNNSSYSGTRTTTQQNRSSSWSNSGSYDNSGSRSSSSSSGGTTRSHSSGSGSGSNGRTRGRD
jgi:hypothetical protein